VIAQRSDSMVADVRWLSHTRPKAFMRLLVWRWIANQDGLLISSFPYFLHSGSAIVSEEAVVLSAAIMQRIETVIKTGKLEERLNRLPYSCRISVDAG